MWSSVHQFFMLAIFLHTFLVHAQDASKAANADPEYTYGEGDEKGPRNWGKLLPEWETCGKGRHQSPIDINTRRVTILQSLGHLARTYKPAPALLVNRGHDIMVRWVGDAGGVRINGTRYALRQCHWHTPAEHTIDHKRFNMEIHLVHASSLGQIAVVGIPYKLGTPDPFLAKILGSIKRLGGNGASLDLGVISPWEIKFGSRKYFRYTGSLTAPPCSEGVVWTLLNKVRTASKDQIAALREAVEDGFENNARPVQKLHGRTVYQYRP